MNTQKGSEIIGKLEQYSYNNCQENLLQEIIGMLQGKIVVDEAELRERRHNSLSYFRETEKIKEPTIKIKEILGES